MRGWHGGLSISAKVKGKQIDQAYEYINWWLDGWPAAFVARQGYYHSSPRFLRRGWVIMGFLKNKPTQSSRAYAILSDAASLR